MKKIFTLLLCICAGFGMASCKGGEDKKQSNDSSPTQSSGIELPEDKFN